MAAEFTGAQSENAVREFLQRLVPSPVEGLRSDAYRVYAQTGNIDQALEALAQAERLDPANDDIRIDRAALLVHAGRHDEARAAISSLRPLTQMDERVTGLMAKLDLTRAAADAPSGDALKQRLAANANDLEARLQLAHLHVARGAYREALEELLQIIRTDRRYRDDVARKTILQIFELLGNEGELVSEFRRKLASAMN